MSDQLAGQPCQVCSAGGWLMRACPREAKLRLSGVDAALELDVAYRAAGL